MKWFLLLFLSCPTIAQKTFLQSLPLHGANAGICIYDDSLKKFIAGFQDDHYFIPASNTKIFTLYAGLKYLGDSLPGIRYLQNDSAYFIFPTGDPSLLHRDFLSQPVIGFLKSISKKIYIVDTAWQDEPLGRGWKWDDYNDDYSAERNSFPVYGNTIQWVQQKDPNSKPGFESSPNVFSIPEVSWKVTSAKPGLSSLFSVKRKKDENIFEVNFGIERYKTQDVPFVTNGLTAAIGLLKDTIGKTILPVLSCPVSNISPTLIYSRPVDSIFIPMMHESNNFFAEQTLMMVSNNRFGYMNDEKIISLLLNTDLDSLPQKPVWADGSGASDYNLFTPQDFVWLLSKMKNTFGMKRMRSIFPTGGQGTLLHLYKKDSGYIFAKTGSFTAVVALSGYLYSRQNHLLIFSVMVNNFTGSGMPVRKEIERYIESVRNNN